MPSSSGFRVGIVLAGGAARGAYEVGILDYLVNDVRRALGRDIPMDILCGTSVGAINACLLAAHADEPTGRVAKLEKHWRALRVGHVLRPDSGELFSMVRNLFGARPVGPRARRPGGVLDTTGLERLVVTAVPFERISDNMRAGRLDALTVSTTHVASGRTYVFVERAGGGLPPWSHEPTIQPVATQISAQHTLASAAIPFLFPPVQIDGIFHCDGGLRQNVPLSPARRLGADGLIVVLPKYVPDEPAPAEEPEEIPTPFTLIGKTLNALLLDRLDADIDRLQRINSFLDAGTRLYGPNFNDAINVEMGNKPGRGLRPLRVVLIRASENIAKMAVDVVRAPQFETRASGMVGGLLRRLADGGKEGRESDLLSYLLFDGDFAARLIELGRSDARAHHDELCEFFEGALAARAPT